MLNNYSDSDIAKLIYRDNIRLKHACRKRLGTELESKPVLASLRQTRTEAIAEADAPEPLSKALVAYLIEAGGTRGIIHPSEVSTLFPVNLLVYYSACANTH